MRLDVEADNAISRSDARRIPILVKIGLCAFLAVMIPFYVRAFGGGNLLFFCDVALFLGSYGILREKALPLSAAAVGTTVIQLVWTIDLVGTVLGTPIVNMTSYMLDPSTSRLLRFLECFHAWLPFLFIFAMARLGYDRRAFWVWTAIAWTLMLISLLFYRAPGDPVGSGFSPANLNFVYGPVFNERQTFMPHGAWVALLFTGLPLCVYWPTHYVLSRFMPTPDTVRARDQDGRTEAARGRSDAGPRLA